MVKIATRVYTQETIIIGDEGEDLEVTIRPLPIARLRTFMNEWAGMQKVAEEAEKAVKAKKDFDEEGAMFDVYINCTAIALSRQLKDKIEKQYDENHKPTAEYREYLENALDQETIFKILDVCGGIKMNDPNFQAMALEMMEQKALDQDGQN